MRSSSCSAILLFSSLPSVVNWDVPAEGSRRTGQPGVRLSEAGNDLGSLPSVNRRFCLPMIGPSPPSRGIAEGRLMLTMHWTDFLVPCLSVCLFVCGGMCREGKKALVNPIRLFEQLEELLPEHAILVADGGDFVATGSYVLNPRSPLSWLDPGAFGTLGVSFSCSLLLSFFPS